MENFKSFYSRVLSLKRDEFDHLALDIFQFQAKHNAVYSEYIQKLGINIGKIKKVEEIPFLPISFFKSHRISTGNWKEHLCFKSSGTTQSGRSQHLIFDPAWYEVVSLRFFEATFGTLSDWNILALLPSYLEQGESSLVYMVGKFIEKTGSALSGFYLQNFDVLRQKIEQSLHSGRKTLLMGVSFALLDFGPCLKDLKPGKNFYLMETGGMKGRRKELIREELHELLRSYYGIEHIYSEYGMTELLSQFYSVGDGLFAIPDWTKVMVRDTNDPFHYVERGKAGGLNIIDLANLHSCCFIETKDIGRQVEENSLEILGRFDNSDIRGCNLLLET